jgi:hypothetical protein
MATKPKAKTKKPAKRAYTRKAQVPPLTRSLIDDERIAAPPGDAAAGPQTSIVKHAHYFRDVSHLKKLDVYRVADLFGVTDQALGAALKKVVAAGQRGAKNTAQDVQEAIDSLLRWQDMQVENAQAAQASA